MTEQEAKQKFCPMMRVGVYSGAAGVAVNRYPDQGVIGEETRCIASQCMMWRWRGSDDFNENRQGFCGLAGKPETVS